MKVLTTKINKIASSPWFVVVGTLCSIAGFAWLLYDELQENSTLASIIFFSISLVIMLAGYAYSFKVRVDLIASRDISEIFCEINHIYRDTLKNLFSDDNPISDPEYLLSEEEETLKAICQRVDDLFTRLIGRDCSVTIKLLYNENGKSYATTLTRSEDKSIRDKTHRKKYEVGTGDNSAFDAALQKKNGNKEAHYFSPNLKKETDYTNQRSDYIKYYKSTLIVPIRSTNFGKEGTNEEFDNIGLLCIDTMSTNRLNNRYHLNMLLSLSNQMYNFISLMRGKYTVLVG